MIYFGLVCVLLHLAQGRDRFNFETQGGNVTTRFGGKYLGYYLSTLGAAFGRPQGIPIQTDTGSTRAPTAATAAPSPFPTAPPPTAVTSVTNPQTIPTQPPSSSTSDLPSFTIVTSLPNNERMTPPDINIVTFLPSDLDASITEAPQITAVTSITNPSPFPTARPPSPFPTAPPTINTSPVGSTAPGTSFPTGIVTSFDQISSTVAIAQNTAPGTVGADGVTQCGCIMASACINRNVQGRVDVRVVTNAPSGVVCPQGYVYCCTQTASFACGFPFEVPIEGLQPDAGEALMGEFPWSAMIRLVNGTYMGGGTLVSSRHIITVAHNVFGKGLPLAAFRVRLGDWDREGEYEPLDHLDIPVTDAVPHPQYDPASLTNDIAVLTLGLTVPLLTMPVPHINAICMPGQNVPFTGRRCFVAGWGREQFNGPYPDVIKKVDVPIITAAECQARIRAAGIPNFNLDPASFVCAGGEPNKDACTGDGGNALACLVDGQFYVAGLAVGGIRCGMANVPGLYTNVPSFANWINAIIRPPVQIVPRTG